MTAYNQTSQSAVYREDAISVSLTLKAQRKGCIVICGTESTETSRERSTATTTSDAEREAAENAK